MLEFGTCLDLLNCDLRFFIGLIREMFINRKIMSKNENNSNLIQRAIVIEVATVVI